MISLSSSESYQVVECHVLCCVLFLTYLHETDLCIELDYLQNLKNFPASCSCGEVLQIFLSPEIFQNKSTNHHQNL